MNVQPRFDVFVSYAHVDDDALEIGAQGFVTRICRYIQIAGRIKRGKPISLFFDQNMATGTAFDSEIADALRASTIFLPILSASWENSDYCDRELRAFKSTLVSDLEGSTRKPVFPILFEKSVTDIQGELRNVHIKHSFQFNMTRDQFEAAAEKMTTELVDQLKFFEERGRLKATGVGV